MRKCLIAESRFLAPALFVALALAGASDALASTPSPAVLKQQIGAAARSPGFDSLLRGWQTRYGVSAVAPLLKLASDRTLADPDRYIAVMGAARLGGAGAADRISPLLKDSSWMIRSAALKALRAIGIPAFGRAALGMLRDPALVVRMEAVDAVVALKPEGSVSALVQMLKLPANSYPALQSHTVAALETITGKPLKAGAPLAEKVRAWSQAKLN